MTMSLTTSWCISLDFTMCNPPFYGSAEEIASSEAGKARLPFAVSMLCLPVSRFVHTTSSTDRRNDVRVQVCTGAENEMITPGGEVAFVSRMIQETPSLGLTTIR